MKRVSSQVSTSCIRLSIRQLTTQSNGMFGGLVVDDNVEEGAVAAAAAAAYNISLTTGTLSLPNITTIPSVVVTASSSTTAAGDCDQQHLSHNQHQFGRFITSTFSFGKRDISSSTTRRYFHTTTPMSLSSFTSTATTTNNNNIINNNNNNNTDDDEKSSTTNVLDLFAVLNMSRTFKISRKDLKQSYRTLMVQYHPDKQQQQQQKQQQKQKQQQQQELSDNVNVDEIEKVDEDKDEIITMNDIDIDAKASSITHAYQILKEPHTRAIHLLELLGHPIEEQEDNKNRNVDESNNNNSSLSSSFLVGLDFLMHVMEIRERIDEISSSSSSNNNNNNKNEELRIVWDETQKEMKQTIHDLEIAFDHVLSLSSSSSSSFDKETKTTTTTTNANEYLEQCIKLTAQLQYWHRIEMIIHEKMDVL